MIHHSTSSDMILGYIHQEYIKQERHNQTYKMYWFGSRCLTAFLGWEEFNSINITPYGYLLLTEDGAVREPQYVNLQMVDWTITTSILESGSPCCWADA